VSRPSYGWPRAVKRASNESTLGAAVVLARPVEPSLGEILNAQSVRITGRPPGNEVSRSWREGELFHGPVPRVELDPREVAETRPSSAP